MNLFHVCSIACLKSWSDEEKTAAKVLLGSPPAPLDGRMSVCTRSESTESRNPTKFYKAMQQMHNVQPITNVKQTLKFA